MDINEIQKLIVRFEEGNCSTEEEQTLYNFFTSNANIPTEWKIYIAYFKNIKYVKNIEVTEKINFTEIADVTLNHVTDNSEKATNINKMTWLDDLWIVAAASIIGGLLFVMSVTNEMTKPLSTQNTVIEYNEADIKKAYTEALNIMQFVAEKLNKGKKPLEHIKKIETINNKIKQHKYETL